MHLIEWLIIINIFLLFVLFPLLIITIVGIVFFGGVICILIKDWDDIKKLWRDMNDNERDGS